MTVWKIVAYHENEVIKEVVSLCKKDKVVAIGWSAARKLNCKKLNDPEEKEKLGKLLKSRYGRYSNWKSAPDSLRRFVCEMRKGDLVVLYQNDNIIACVGKVLPRKYEYNNKNELGRFYGYPHQRKVDWFPKPMNFDRRNLHISFKIRGTINKVDISHKELINHLKKISKKSQSAPEIEVDENGIKQYLKNFINKNVDKLENGLKIIGSETPGHFGRPDFLAKDKYGKMVAIEVKTKANSETVGQLLKYIGAQPKRKMVKRGIILANDVKPSCKKAVKLIKNCVDIHCYSFKFKQIV